MTEKPTMKREVAISSYGSNTIMFYAHPDAVLDFQEYGQMQELNSKDYYILWVDARYDFDEVVAYMQNYG